MKRRLLAIALLVCALGPLPPAAAEAPKTQGWWNVLHRQGLLQPPAPPDVGPKDLLVQGGDVLDELPGGFDRQPQPTAVAALTFAVDPDSTVVSLDLTIKGVAVANDVRAYATSKPFVPVQNGAYELAPPVVLNDMSLGVLSADNTILSFTDISRLVRADGVLSIVLIAGLADRVVITQPDAKALSVIPASEPLPPLPEPTPTPAPPALVDGLPPVEGPAFGPLPPSGQAPPLVQAPVVPAPPAAAPVLRPKAASLDDTTTRFLVLIEALLVALFFGLLGYGPLGRLSRWTGLVTTKRGAPAVRGVGRFSAVRTGKAPQL